MNKNDFCFGFSLILKIAYILIEINQVITDGCQIANNTLIEKQWLNNIICIGHGDAGYRYVNFANFSNGSMVVETTSLPGNPMRLFYGIDNNGRPLFKNNQYHSSIEIKTQSQSSNYRFEAEIFMVKINNKEYLVSIGKGDKFAELYDLEKIELVSQKNTTQFLNNLPMKSIFQFSINYFYDNSDNILFGYTDGSFNFYLNYLKFSSTNLDSSPIVDYTIIPSVLGEVVTCCMTEDKKKIMCMYIYIYYYSYTNFDIFIWIYVYNLDFSEITHLKLDYYNNNKGGYYQFKYDYFMKCINLKEDVGIFAFYAAQDYYTMINYPKLLFKNLNGNALVNFFSSSSLTEINLDYLNGKYFNSYCLLNDMIKISNNKIIYIAASDTKEQLIIVLLNNIDVSGLTIRYYYFEIFKLYTYKFFKDMKIHLYNNKFVSFAFSFCRVSQCEERDDTHYSGFMMFNYPNGTDSSLNLTEYLFNNNNLDNLEIDLKKNFRIENNIFGYIYSATKIEKLNNCDNFEILLSSNEKTYICINSLLENDEKITIKLNQYKAVNCIINYRYRVTEPDYSTFNSYAMGIDTTKGDDSNAFDNQKSIYEGKMINYIITLDEDLDNTQCSDPNCDYCQRDYCIICKYSFNITEDSSGKKKICNPDKNIKEIETTQIRMTTLAKIDTTQIMKTTLPKISTTQLVVTTQIMKTILPKISTTQLIDTTQIMKTTLPKISTTQFIGTTQIMKTTLPKISTTQIMKTTMTKIYTTHIKTTISKSDKPQLIKTSAIKFDTTQIIGKNQTTIFSSKITSNIKNEESKRFCNNKIEIINNECQDGKMTNQQVEEVYTEIKENILTKEYKGENKVIISQNVVFQLSKLDEQKNNDNPNVSSIDLGICEDRLKTKYNISKEDSLIILKSDVKNDDFSAMYVQYEIYNPYNLKKLNLSYCYDVKVEVNIPVNLDNYTILLYDNLRQNGYNLFDSGSEFYNDVCAPYTTINGTDIILEDRKKDIFIKSGNVSLCQKGCDFDLYNITNKRAKCNCNVQTEVIENNIENLEFNANLIADTFLATLKRSNFRVLKCYKLILNFDNIFKNIGRFIMTIIYFLFLVSLFFYIIYDRKKINMFINIIINYMKNAFKEEKKFKNIDLNDINKVKTSKFLNIKNNKNSKGNKKKDNKADKIKNKSKNKNQKKENKNKNTKKDKGNNKSKDKNKNKNATKKKGKNEPPKIKSIKTKNNKNKNEFIMSSKDDISIIKKNKKTKKNCNKININIIPITNINYNQKNKKKNKNKNKNITNNSTKLIPSSSYSHLIKNEKLKDNHLHNEFKLIQYRNLNDEELNNLEYQLAIKIDKRTYLQYYWSLIKKKQLILFTFLPTNDYNLFSLKLALFLLSFSLYFTINGFFFTDGTMHKLYIDNGNYNLLFRIPQILYSSGTSSIINMILKLLSLSEKNILSMKQEKNIKSLILKSKNIKSCIIIKFIIFFLLSNILLLFFWYFISCFCAVYTNTQLILINDTFISFGLSMAYPFGLNLIPGIFRITALRSKKKDKQCMYKISLLIALI